MIYDAVNEIRMRSSEVTVALENQGRGKHTLYKNKVISLSP